MRLSTSLQTLGRLILSVLLVLASIGTPVYAQQLTNTSYTAFAGAFAAPPMTGVGTATLTYGAGTLYLGGTSKAIVAGTFTSLGATKNSCDAPAYSSCEIVYWTSSTALTHSTTFATAYGAGANIIVGYLTTDGSSNILTITPASLVAPPSQSSSLMFSCGASLAAAGACANTNINGSVHFLTGSFVLSGSTSTVTGISPAFTSATSWWCVANDVTTRANPVQAIPGSGTTLVITNTTGATDLIQVMCMGN